MANARDIITGLQVLIAVIGGDVQVDAQHDQIWAGADLEAIESTPPKCAAALRAAGWFWDEEVDSWSLFM